MPLEALQAITILALVFLNLQPPNLRLHLQHQGSHLTLLVHPQHSHHLLQVRLLQLSLLQPATGLLLRPMLPP